ncbi:hypothetical protein [Streptomonospora wellingtoniae]|uniref:Uncharacterized protein n=1 Tax=Streptomonospora wellingtoniae TaxID=3075544 RepID=A0ABU2KUG4_9ACTN|nr:hypothetical protein [Streptomonospora sp. DSM 45055]MDT0302898.1 hypothetical protein [Streptomonospora sp. DSM 45055]
MSKKGAPRRYSIARYVSEATREPFDLELSDETVVKIPQPTTAEMDGIASVASTREVLDRLAETPEDAEKVYAELADAPAGAVMALVKDIREHFGLGG